MDGASEKKFPVVGGVIGEGRQPAGGVHRGGAASGRTGERGSAESEREAAWGVRE